MPVSPLVRSLPIALLLLTVLVGCGGGGGGGGSTGPQQPNDTLGGKFGAVDGPTGAVLPGINSTVAIVFNKKVAPASVTPATLNVVTIDDPAGQADAPGGVLASYTVEVVDNRVLIHPTVEFSQENIAFGFVAKALYEVSFSSPDSGASIESVGGQPIANPSKTFFFRTPTDAIDTKPGYPAVRAFLVDDAGAVTLPEVFVDENEDTSLYEEVLDVFAGAVEIVPPSPSVMTIPSAPVRDVIFVFDDAILPQTVLNPIDGSSPSVRVLVNTATPPEFAPIVAPADLSFLHQQEDLTIVLWRTGFAALPPAAFLIFEVTASVEDLGGNSKVSSTGDASPSLSALVVVDGTVDLGTYTLTEPFDDDAQENVTSTSASWADLEAGYLLPVSGGGRGLDGPLVIDPAATANDPGATAVPLAAVVDYGARRVSLPSVREVGSGVFEPRVWELTRLLLPAGWTLGVLTDRDGDGDADPSEYVVQSPGHPLDGQGAALDIRCTQSIDIAGTVTVDGAAGETVSIPTSFGTYFGQGGRTTDAGVSGGSGGRGGDAILAVDGNDDGQVDTVVLALVSPPVDGGGLPFETAISKRRGVSGRSTSLTANTLRDETKNLSALIANPDIAAMIDARELLLQPNVGIGSTLAFNSGTANQVIDENHPTFVVEGIEVSGVGASTITIVDDAGESMVAASKNVGNGFAPIAASGDSYLLGRFGGAEGGDPSGLARGGQGAQPFLVVNEGALGVTSTGGGGGGGGGVFDGDAGGDSGPASDPAVNQRGVGNGITNGMSLDDSGGAAGGHGALRGSVRVIDDVTLDLVSTTSGPDPSGLAGAALVGALLLPNAPDDGWAFRIASFDGATFVVEPIEAPEGEIVLTSGPAGFAGPALVASEVVPFLVLPSPSIGGAGGGGSGASITGTLNVAASSLPIVTPGAAGGAGGGALLLESARDVILRNTALLSARGGVGGEVVDPSLRYAGGGGGGGGSITVRATQTVSLFQGAGLDTDGGLGGGIDAYGRGGDGGAGWVRLETGGDTLAPEDLDGFTLPAAKAENVGRFIGQALGVGVSRYYVVGVANPDYESVTVTYRADTDADDVPEEPLTWTFGVTGADGGVEGYTRPPFRLQFNPAGVSESGLQDAANASPTFYEVYDLLSARTGLAWNATAGVLLYSVGEDIEGFRFVDDACLGTDDCDDLPLSTIPDVGDEIDVVSVGFGGVDDEIFMLERGTGRVIVLDGITGAYLRSIRLPSVLEGGITILSDGVDPDADRLLVAANREEVLVTFAVRDSDAVSPSTTDYEPSTFLDAFGVSRDGVPLEDLELTGLSYDPVGDRVWCVDAPTGTVFEIDVSAGNEGVSLTGTHVFARLLVGASPTLLSSIAFDGALLHVVRAVEADATTLVTLDPADLVGDEFVLPDLGSVLPMTAQSIGDGDVFVRFRIAIDGTFTDEEHPGGPVSFRDVAIDEIEFSMRNASF